MRNNKGGAKEGGEKGNNKEGKKSQKVDTGAKPLHFSDLFKGNTRQYGGIFFYKSDYSRKHGLILRIKQDCYTKSHSKIERGGGEERDEETTKLYE